MSSANCEGKCKITKLIGIGISIVGYLLNLTLQTRWILSRYHQQYGAF